MALSWDETVDFLAVGSGAAGMTAAIRAHDLGASTLVIEKAATYGGSTALSGGVIWVPGNPLMKAAGIEDSPEEGLQYLEQIVGDSSPLENLRAYVETAPRMMEYLAEHSRLHFEIVHGYPDYYSELQGGQAGGRSCEAAGVDAIVLGEEFRRLTLHPPAYHPFHFMTPLVREGMPLIRAGVRGTLILLSHLIKFIFNFRAHFRGMRNTHQALGGALATRARWSLLDRGVPLWLETSLEDLVLEEGRVVGAILRREGRIVRVRARRGVLLGMGGFESNAALRQRHQQGPIGSDWTAGAESNTGDALAIAERIDAQLDLLDESWWCPTVRLPDEDFTRLVVYEKNVCGGIIVNARGERFMNEAGPYNDVVKSIYAAHSEDTPAIPAFMIFDARCRHSFPLWPILPGRLQPDWALPKRLWKFVTKDATLEGLAGKLGIEAEGLCRTVDRFNEFARTGKDLDFGRGDAIQDRYYTARPTGPNPSLGEVREGPFYAVKIWPGDIGTKGGMCTDARARVLDRSGAPIPGLYASGNCTAATMGRTYPGAGGTIGPAMVFGFIAAEEVMRGTQDAA